jgi:hypothetical protein
LPGVEEKERIAEASSVARPTHRPSSRCPSLRLQGDHEATVTTPAAVAHPRTVLPSVRPVTPRLRIAPRTATRPATVRPRAPARTETHPAIIRPTTLVRTATRRQATPCLVMPRPA